MQCLETAMVPSLATKHPFYKKLQIEPKKKEKLCNKYCHTAFKTGSLNPGKQLASKLNFSSTKDEAKCKKLCKGRGYIDIMNRLRGAVAHARKMSSDDKHELNLACTKHSRKYLQEIFGSSCGRHCAKLKSKGKYLSSGGSIGSRKQCKKACKKKKSAFQKAALSFCSGSVSQNPLIMLLHTREEDYMKPIGNIKNEVQKFWDSFTTTVNGRTVKALPDKVLWNDGDISSVIFQDDEDDAKQSEEKKKSDSDDELEDGDLGDDDLGDGGRSSGYRNRNGSDEGNRDDYYLREDSRFNKGSGGRNKGNSRRDESDLLGLGEDDDF